MTSSPSYGIFKSGKEDDLISEAMACESGDAAPIPSSAKTQWLARTSHFLGASLLNERYCCFLFLLLQLQCKLFRTGTVSSNAIIWYKAWWASELVEAFILKYEKKQNNKNETWLYFWWMLRLQFCTPKGNNFFLNKIKNTCFSQKSYIWGKTNYKNKYQCICSAPRIFSHLQVFCTFLHVSSHTETTEAETKHKPATLAIRCQTTQDIVLETAKKPSFTLLAYLSICCLPGKYQVSFT